MGAGEAQRLMSMQQDEEDLEAAAAQAQRAAAAEGAWLAELDAAFSRTGIQSFAIEGILGELQVRHLVCYHTSSMHCKGGLLNSEWLLSPAACPECC